MSPQAKWEYLEAIRGRYRSSGRRDKGLILDEFCAVCGYSRKYAVRLLSRGRPRRRNRPGPPRRYGPEVVTVLKRIWLAAEQMCSKRLKAALPLWLPHYERKYGALPEATRQRVLALSPATMDRLLKPIRAKSGRKGLSGTRPGTLLRQQIPIQTQPWDITQPGFLEADTVAHCGNSLAGSFIWSLTFTDIYSGWTENRAVWNKGSAGVLAQIQDIEEQLAFPLLGFDSDNGSEFLNHHLWRYFAQRPAPVAFTRSRPYRKNDNAHVEQKHWTHVRQLFGYDRFDRPQMLDPMNRLYAQEWSLLQNYFCPSMKLKSKERLGARYRRCYESPRTPYERLLACDQIAPQAKQRLQQTFASLDPFALKKGIERQLKIIFNLLRSPRS